MPQRWTEQFQDRMRRFEGSRPERGLAISVKVRVVSGCFHREHSPNAYLILDQHLTNPSTGKVSAELLEHESGPEILIWLAAGTAVAALAKSIVDLVVVILKARSEGIQKGDSPQDPLEVIVRRSIDRDSVKDECIIRVGHRDSVDRGKLEQLIEDAIRRLEGSEDGTSQWQDDR